MIPSDLAPVLSTNLPFPGRRGKVRDVYAVDHDLLMVATDRISAFDVVMNEPIPGKGAVLTQMSRYWLETLPACRPHHLKYVVDADHIPPGCEPFIDLLQHRAMLCRKTEVLPIECVVRGYLIGGGWREYQQTGAVSDIELPRGLQLAQQLDEPIFTPSTKAASGHDEPISFERACELVGDAPMHVARQRALEIYRQAADYARQRGVIIADTKFEFGVADNELLLVDEVLTPDSSRFWPADGYEVGRNPASFDKQYVRDFLESVSWNKQPPPPALPEDVVRNTRAKYVEAYERLTGDATQKS